MAFAYDSAGNRTSMADGLGSVTYAYDQLSRLTSETRIFTGVGTFPLNYAYNLAGELAGITDPFNAQVGYHYDTAGRLNSVTGSGYGNVSTYASNVQYRAWGGIKGMTYGNNLSLSASYNSGLQMVQFELAGRPPDYGVSTVMKTHADYYADGAIKYAYQLVAENEKFDRAFSYDHVAMLKETYTGSESRDFVNGTNSGEPTGPYRQTYQHDAFGNMTNKANRYWSFSDNFTASYTNQRRQGFQYDPEGHLLQDNDLQYTFDAAGQSVSVHTVGTNNRTIALSIDGGGQVLRRTEMQGGDTNSIVYYVRSSVLGGKIITQLDQNGQKQKGYVFADGELLAHQENGLVRWHHKNPLSGGTGISGSEGWFNPEAEPDPTGINIGFEDPYLSNAGPPPSDEFMPSLLGSSSPGKCVLDGMAIDCADAMERMSMGNAVPCPDNYCGPTSWDDTRNGAHSSGVTNGFQALADGRSGFLPVGWTFAADGVMMDSSWTGGDSETLAANNGLGFGSLAQGLASSFTSGAGDRKKKRRRPDMSPLIVAGVGAESPLKLLPGFDSGQEGLIRQTLDSIKQNTRCTKAFAAATGSTPAGLIDKGIVVGPAFLLRGSNQQIGITEDSRKRLIDDGFVGSMSKQAVTIRNWPGYTNELLFDATPRVLLNASAFNGGNYSLREVLVHELLHVAGWPPSGQFRSLFHSTDLSHYDKYDEIMAACGK